MIIGIGTDIVSVDRITDLEKKFGEKFATKIFTENEKTIAEKFSAEGNFSKKSSFYAKRFAAKEAFSKACGLGIGRGINFLDIEVVNDELGKPFINILNGKNDFLCKYFDCKKFIIHLSLSDENIMAQAFVIIEKI